MSIGIISDNEYITFRSDESTMKSFNSSIFERMFSAIQDSSCSTAFYEVSDKLIDPELKELMCCKRRLFKYNTTHDFFSPGRKYLVR